MDWKVEHRAVWRACRLCGRIHALDDLKLAFKEYIKKFGLTLVMHEEKVGGARPSFHHPRC